MTDATGENGEVASLDHDLWDVVQFKVDRKDRTNWLKIGRAWKRPEASNITVKLYALPTSNQDGDVVITLVPRK